MKKTEKKISGEEKRELVEACLGKQMRVSDAASRAGVHVSNVYKWISQYRAEGAAAFQGERKVYSKELKRKAVEEYVAGQGSLLSISEKYKIRSPSVVLDWVRVYNRHNNAHRSEGESNMANTRKYTVEERVQIVKEHFEDGKSISELAKEHDLGYHLVYDWVKKYKANGVSGLEDRRGQRKAAQEPRTPEEELRVQIAQLERENYLLKMENDLLKKVKELERGEA